MSEASFQPRVRVTRVRALGDAVPIGRGPFAETTDEPKIVPKSTDELRAEREAARDAQPMTTSCGVDECDWTAAGTAGDCRDAAATHRAASHPELAGIRTHRGGTRFKRRGETIDPAIVAESRRLRQERDDAARLETIERGRKARGEPLEEVAAERLGPDGATSSSRSTTTTPTGRETVNTCKIEGCEEDASDAPKAGPTARLCVTHRIARSAALSAERTGRPRGSTARLTPPQPAPEPEPVPDEEELPPAAELELRDAPPGHGTPLTRLLARLPADQLAGASSEYDAAIDRLQREHDVVLRALDLQERAA